MQRRQESNRAEGEFLVVSNSSVIIALARICRLDLLEKPFGKILVSEAVWREIAVKGKPGHEKIVRADFIHVGKAGNRRLVTLLEGFVDSGEAEAIVLALERNADLLLVDDRDAREIAKKLGLQVMGTLGVIALAKYGGLIPKAKPIIDKLVESGFWISRKLLEEFLRELSEL
ncbi:MAG: DUF3368 domain-containing protein [Desulfurococcales archaeon]|nr:DUF3368 domain-containing protein [Desulfurococcales archaeon]